ncbi:phosphoribosyltransferase, partial [Streptomyces arboris]|uniref:phosphoribosyltransferase n=1 Tax=Streptomyces arboris TaxID=2600619 RepID=UPI003631C4E1
VSFEREVLTWDMFGRASRELALQVTDSGWLPDVVVAVARGGLVPGGAIAYALRSSSRCSSPEESAPGRSWPAPAAGASRMVRCTAVS